MHLLNNLEPILEDESNRYFYEQTEDAGQWDERLIEGDYSPVYDYEITELSDENEEHVTLLLDNLNTLMAGHITELEPLEQLQGTFCYDHDFPNYGIYEGENVSFSCDVNARLTLDTANYNYNYIGDDEEENDDLEEETDEVEAEAIQ